MCFHRQLLIYPMTCYSHAATHTYSHSLLIHMQVWNYSHTSNIPLPQIALIPYIVHSLETFMIVLNWLVPIWCIQFTLLHFQYVSMGRYHHLATRAAKLEKMTLERADPGNNWKREKKTQTFAYLFSLDSMLLEYLYKLQHQAAL